MCRDTTFCSFYKLAFRKEMVMKLKEFYNYLSRSSAELDIFPGSISATPVWLCYGIPGKGIANIDR